MKKKLIIIACIIFSSTTFSQQQFSGRVYYTFSMKPFSEKTIDSVTKKSKGKSKKIKKWVQDTFKNIKDVTAILEFANGESLYYIPEEMKVEGKPKLNLGRIMAGGKSKYYLNHNKKDYFYQTSIFGDEMLVEIKPKKWKITQETQKIGGFLCYKAIDIESTDKKKKPVAWFTTQIPVNSGPTKNFGLPGLILKFEKYRRSFTAVKIELNPSKKIIIKKPTKGKRLSNEEYTKFIEKMSPFRKRKRN
jgi:GLPGLI family protein